MNDARALSRDVALLAGSLGDLVQMDVMGRVAAQNLEGSLFALGVARSDPQQESAVVQMLIEMLGALVTDVARQSCRDQTAGSAGSAAATNTPSSVLPEPATARPPNIAGT